MRVALLYPEVYDMARFAERRKEFPPFGVLYLAAVIEDAGHEVSVQKVTPTGTLLDLTGFDAVGFSLASSVTYGVMRRARDDAAIRDDALIMVGGVHANFYPAQSLVDFRAHVLCQGESERTILEVLARAADGSRSFAGIVGTWWMDGGWLRQERPRAQIGDIDCLPLPARHLLPVEDIVIPDRLAGRDLPMAHVMFSRGCPFPCAFCAAGRTRVQYRSGTDVRTELVHLMDRYRIKGFGIVDDNFIVNKRKVTDICEHITDLGLTWSALSRVDTVDRPLLDAMADAGCIEIKYGVESGSETLLKAMGKNTTRAQIKKAFALTADAGIEAKAFIRFPPRRPRPLGRGGIGPLRSRAWAAGPGVGPAFQQTDMGLLGFEHAYGVQVSGLPDPGAGGEPVPDVRVRAQGVERDPRVAPRPLPHGDGPAHERARGERAPDRDETTPRVRLPRSEVSSVPLQQVLRTQQKAFANFFAKRARYPRFKSRTGRQSAEYTRSAFRWRGGRLYLAKQDGPLDDRVVVARRRPRHASTRRP